MKFNFKKILGLTLFLTLIFSNASYALENSIEKQITRYSDGEIEFEVLDSIDSKEGLIVKCAITNNTSKEYTFNKRSSYILDMNNQDYSVTQYEKDHNLVTIRSGARNIVNIFFEDAKKDSGPYQLITFIGDKSYGFFDTSDGIKLTFSNIN